MRIRKAVIPAAGLGTRFLPATKAQPKEMLPIVDTPIIQYVVHEAIESGIEDILIITGRGKRAIEDHFDRSVELEQFLAQKRKPELLDSVQEIANFADIHFIRQKEPLGLGHAVFMARRHVGNEPFAVLLGDELFDAPVPCLKQLMMEYEKVNSSVLAVRPVAREEVSRYGIIELERISGSLYRVIDLVEKPDPAHAPSDLAVIGRYIIEPEVFDILAEQEPGVGGEIQLTDALRVLNRTRPIYACEVEGTRYDVGDKLGFLEATVEYALKRPDLGVEFLQYLERLVASRRSS